MAQHSGVRRKPRGPSVDAVPADERYRVVDPSEKGPIHDAVPAAIFELVRVPMAIGAGFYGFLATGFDLDAGKYCSKVILDAPVAMKATRDRKSGGMSFSKPIAAPAGSR